MGRRIRLTREALIDLRGIIAWESQPGSGRAARARLLTLERGLLALRDFHYRGKCHADGLRTVVIARCRVIYAVGPDTAQNAAAGDVTIVRVMGPVQTI